MKNQDQLTELKIDEWIWITFIALSLLNIFGDEYEKDYCLNNDIEKDRIAKKIFTFTVFISLLIYLYLAYQRYHKVKKLRLQCQDSKIWETRLFGSMLVVLATILFLYCQIEDTNASNPSIV
ncbi:MAG: hypothetical protein MR598_00085 [Erysipelotrichaceae bacterium]|nr:hypothetical protein [Erysipelotrichaceae bacterium]